ncbi:MAG: T9SS type A sorting domain-containing protein [Saprospiraceae bacterium]|nr:T9SS type A sorting domain-containing protein [Saprospiraceae bacterium]
MSIFNEGGIVATQDIEKNIDTPLNNNVILSPNPTHDFLNLTFPTGLLENGKVVIADINGNIVHTEYYNNSIEKFNLSIYIDKLKSGVYICTIINNGYNQSKPFIKH